MSDSKDPSKIDKADNREWPLGGKNRPTDEKVPTRETPQGRPQRSFIVREDWGKGGDRIK